MNSRVKTGCILAGILMLNIVSFLGGRCSAPEYVQKEEGSSVLADIDELDAFRTERQQLRQMQLNQLSEMIHAEDTEPEITVLARERQLELMDWSEKETTLEGVLKIRGFKDAVATVHEDSANIIIRAETVSKQEAAVILELVTRETGISSGNVKIIPVN